MLENPGSYSIRNFIPFTEEVYLRLFERQFEAWWPAHVAMLALGAAIIVLACLGKARAVAVALAVPFAASAATFHFRLYAELSPVGKIFGWAFILQIPLILAWGFATKSRENFRPRAHAIAGALIAALALFAYPLLALPSGRNRTGAEWFGLAPDPTVAFFLGIILLSARPAWFPLLLPIPLLWTAATWATLDTFGAPFAIALPAIAGITVAAGIWKAVVQRRPEPCIRA